MHFYFSLVNQLLCPFHHVLLLSSELCSLQAHLWLLDARSGIQPLSSECCLAGKGYYLLQHLSDREIVTYCCRSCKLLLLCLALPVANQAAASFLPGLVGALVLGGLFLLAETGHRRHSKSALPTAATHGFHHSLSQH